MMKYLLLLVIISSTLLFGAVESWSICVVGILTVLSFIPLLVRFPYRSADQMTRKVICASAVLLAYGLFQLFPLPAALITVVHPKMGYILQMPPPVTVGERTIPGPEKREGPSSLQSPSTQTGQGFFAPPSSQSPLPQPRGFSVPSFHSFSIYPFATEVGVAYLAVYLMVFFMAAFGFDRKDELYAFLKALIIFGFILAIFGIIQKTTGTGKIYWLRELSIDRSQPFSSFVNRNHFAGWLNMIIPFALAYGFMARTVDKKIRYLFLALAMAVVLVFTLSRGGIIAFFAGVFVFSAVALAGRSSKKRLIPLFLFVLVLGISVLYIGLSPVMSRFTQVDIFHHERLTVWKAAFEGFLSFPVFGTGIGTFEYIFKMFSPPTWFFYDHAHNDYVQFLMETGIAGVCIGIIVVAVILRYVIESEWTEREAFMKAAFYGSLTTIAVHSVFDFNLRIPSNAILLAVVLGLGLALSRLNETEEEEEG